MVERLEVNPAELVAPYKYVRACTDVARVDGTSWSGLTPMGKVLTGYAGATLTYNRAIGRQSVLPGLEAAGSCVVASGS